MTRYNNFKEKPSTQASNGFLIADNKLKVHNKGRSRFQIDIGMRKI